MALLPDRPSIWSTWRSIRRGVVRANGRERIFRVRKAGPEFSDESDRDVDIAAGGFGIGANPMRFVDEFLSEFPVNSRDGDVETSTQRVTLVGQVEVDFRVDRDLARQKTLRATLDWSFQLLSDLERVVLRRLAVFVGYFTLDAALEVVTSAALDRTAAFRSIDSLVEKSMVATRPVGAMMRYRLLDTTRDYALELSMDQMEMAELAGRHAGLLSPLARADR